MRPASRAALHAALVPSRPALVGVLALLAGCGGLSLPWSAPTPTAWGFTAPWDARSARSVAEHGSSLDAVVTGWIALDTLGGAPQPTLPDTVAIGDARRMALVTTFSGGRWHPELVRALGQDTLSLARTAGAVAELASHAGYRGLVLDFEEMARADVGFLHRVARALTDSAHARGITPVALMIPATDTAGYPARLLVAAADLIVVTLYDQHWGGSPPGAVAEPAWARQWLGVRIAEIGADRLVAALPLYGYQWRVGLPTNVISYDDARRLSEAAGVRLAREPATRSMRSLRDGEWELWVSDAELVRALAEEARGAGVRKFALWRLGLEDPAIWTERPWLARPERQSANATR